eukprot:2645060-Pyramimonas_sp.AAC.1
MKFKESACDVTRELHDALPRPSDIFQTRDHRAHDGPQRGQVARAPARHRGARPATSAFEIRHASLNAELQSASMSKYDRR